MQVSEREENSVRVKKLRKITRQRLKNIALYYLQRFETSSENLRRVLLRRVNEYAFYNPDFNVAEARGWVDEIVEQFQGYKYVDDSRYAGLKIRDYLAAGKSEKYIRQKMAEKGVPEDIVNEILENEEFDPLENALQFARKKRIGRFRPEEQREAFRQKDLAALARAGFDYDVAIKVCSTGE